MKQRLRTTVIPMLKATATTGLGRMAWVYLLDTDTTRCRLVVNKAMELSKAPTMEPSFEINRLVLFATPYLRGLPNMREVFKNKGCTLWGMLYNAFREDMVMVFALPKQFPGELFEVSLCAPGAFGLQFSYHAEDATFLLFPASLS